MPIETIYQYSITDFQNNTINVGQLEREISDSEIIIDVKSIVKTGDGDSAVVDITFRDELSEADLEILDGNYDENPTDGIGGLIAAHVAQAAESTEQVIVAGYSGAAAAADGLPYVITKASGLGMVMSSRDALLKMSNDDGDTVCDFKVNPLDGSRPDWGELTLVGVYKSSNVADIRGFDSSLVPCPTNEMGSFAICSIFDYVAKDDQGNLIDYEIRSGTLYVDFDGTGFGDGNDREAHQIYVVAAPGLPGGNFRFFDSYLEPYRGNLIKVESVDAIKITAVPGFALASTLRVWIYYEPGWSGRHVLSLTTYRSTF